LLSIRIAYNIDKIILIDLPRQSARVILNKLNFAIRSQEVMISGTLNFLAHDGRNRYRSLRLTVCSGGDWSNASSVDMRRARLGRLMEEATTQGARLSYRDLTMITLSSRATLKRDVRHLRRLGFNIPMGGTH
jgi:hypothetical protein